MSTVKERPIAAAAVAAASVGAGVFLWSKRNALSEQMSNLSEPDQRLDRKHALVGQR